MEIEKISAKSIIQKSKLPDCDYVVNPYTGCRFGCTYCYASFMGRYVGKENNDWGEYVYIKINAPKLFEEEIKKIPNNGKNLSIFFSSVTDPYQGLEAKYRITRKCMKVISKSDFLGAVSILTKSPIVIRDIDIFKEIKNIEVGLTITSVNDGISKYFEKNAPSVSSRLEVLKEFNENNIKTYAFIGPLLPHYVQDKNNLDNLFKSIRDTGTEEIYIEHINLKKYIIERLENEMPDLDKDILDKFYKSQDKNYREDLNKILYELVEKYKFKLRLESAIYHRE